MADDPYARIAQLEAEVAALRQREAELVAAAKRRNRVDAEATERQAATDDVLRIIAGSPTRLQPVLQAIAENAAQVCGAEDAHLRLLEEDQLRLVAAYGTVPGQSLERRFPPARSRPAAWRSSSAESSTSRTWPPSPRTGS